MNERNTANPSSESEVDPHRIVQAVSSCHAVMRKLDDIRITFVVSAEQRLSRNLTVTLAGAFFFEPRYFGTQERDSLVKLRN